MIDLAYRQVIQVTVVSLLAAAMGWLCRRRPHLAHVLGLIVLIKCWTPPIFSSQGGVFCWPPIRVDGARQSEPRFQRVRPSTRSQADDAAGADLQQRTETTQTDHRDSLSLTTTSANANSTSSLAGWLFAIWLTGAFVFILATGIRWRRWQRGLAASAARPGSRLMALATDAAMSVGLRRAPALVVATSGGGPAVYGVLRPTIVIPHRLLTAENADNLRMVLTHEMSHVRRGDLYVSLLQFATLAVWWFHPALWWTCRRLTQVRERSCDEEVLAALRCSPVAYAQCLLDTLRQRRHDMAPAFPGMRAVDVTRTRIEHIMLAGDSARARTPRRYWLFAAVALLVLLPGQRLHLTASDEVVSPESDVQETPAKPKATTPPNESTPLSPNQTVAGDDAAKTAEPTKRQAARDEDQPPSRAERLERAIHRGIGYLKSEQVENGRWPDPVGYPGGITGLCTLALLKRGMQPDEGAAASALNYLRAIKPSMTYSTSLQTLVFCAADAQAERKLIQRNVKWLVQMQKAAGPFAGAWGYPQAEGDNSNTAFAVWALYEADRAGLPAGVAVWRRTLDYWLKNQNADGSWGYKPGLGGTGSMTSQGLFCVAATATVLGDDKPHQSPAKAMEKAVAWLANHFSVDENPGAHGQQGWHLYYLLALGKAGRISGREEFGDHRWPAEVADVLLDRQRPDGSWQGVGHAEDNPNLATGLALLTLIEAR